MIGGSAYGHAVPVVIRAAVDRKREGVRLQLVVDIQYRAAVRRDHHAGGGVLLGVLLPALAVEGRGVAGLHRGAHDAGDVVIGAVEHVGGRRARIVVLFKHVHDGVAHGSAVPLRVDGGVAVDGHGAARSLGERLVQVPAAEGIAVAGGGFGGQGRGGAIGIRAASHIAAAIGLIGQLEVLAVVVDVQLLAGGLGDGITLGMIQHREFKGLHGGGDIAAEYALHVFLAGFLDLGIALAGQVLQHVHKVIRRREGYVLDPFGDRGQVVFKVIDGDLNGRRLGIIDIPGRNLLGIGLGAGRSRDGVGQLARIHLDHVGIEHVFLLAVVDVEVFRGDRIDGDIAEHGLGGNVAVDHGISGDFLLGIRVDPLLEHLARHKGRLGHGADELAGIAEVLLKLFAGFLDDERDGILIREGGGQGQVGGDGLAALILGFPGVPTGEILALHHGIGGQGQGVAGIIGIGLVVFLAHLEGDGEHVLIILGPHVGVGADGHLVVEVAIGVHPLAGVAGLLGHGGDVVHAVVAIDGDVPGGQLLGLILVLVEGDRIGYLVIVRHDLDVLGGHIAAADARAGDTDLLALGAVDDLADGPVGVIVLARDGGGHLVANGLALLHLHGRMDLGVTVVERDGPGGVRRPKEGLVHGIQHRVAIDGVGEGRSVAILLLRPVGEAKALAILAGIGRRGRRVLCGEGLAGFNRKRLFYLYAVRVEGHVGVILLASARDVGGGVGSICQGRHGQRLEQHEQRQQDRQEPLLIHLLHPPSGSGIDYQGYPSIITLTAPWVGGGFALSAIAYDQAPIPTE